MPPHPAFPRDGVSPRNTESRSRTLNGSATRRIDSRKCDAISRAISRNDIVRPSRVRQSHTSMSHANGFFGKCDSRASQPLRAMCRPGFNPSMSGTPHASRSRKRYESHSMMSRVMPTISAVAAAISPGSGVKSNVTSTRSRRGRTPIWQPSAAGRPGTRVGWWRGRCRTAWSGRRWSTSAAAA